MGELPDGSAARKWFFSQHKSLGLTIGMLACIRLCWRFITPPPAPHGALSALEIKAAHIGHQLLYLLMFLQPLSGYLSSSFSGYKTRFWGIPLPHWGWEAPNLNELFSEVHDTFSVILLVLVAIHIGAVIRHRWRGESVMARMWPWGTEPPYSRPEK